MAFLGLGRRRSYRGNPNESAALTAAGFRVTHQDTDQLRRLIQPWQARSFSFYDQLGEIKYASQFYSRMLSPLRLYAAKKDAAGDWQEIEDPSSPADRAAVEALERIQDPGGGRESLLGSYGRLMFLVGECYLLCSKDAETGLEQWEMLSTDELRIQSGVYIRYKSPTMAAENLHEVSDDDFEPLEDDEAVAYRLWRRHPRYSMLADSTMMGVLDLCEELLLLTRAVRARARSRLAGSGILAISEEFSHAPLEAMPGENPDVDPFLADLIQAMTLPISQEGAASAVVPLLLRGPTEAIEKGLRLLQIIDPTQLYPETGLRYEIIKRIALGLDMPAEVLLGLEEANHWTAWQIDEQTWKGHGMPVANQLVNDLNGSYFLPDLRSQKISAWQDYGIRYDAAGIINHPNRSADAKDLYGARAIGKKPYRDALGFDDSDAPSKEELAEMVGVATRDSSLAWFGTPAPRGGAVETAPGEITSDQPGDVATSPEGAPTGADVEKGPPRQPPEDEPVPVVGAARRGAELVAARVAGAADLAILRAREAAGNRLRSLAKRDPEVEALLEGVTPRAVAAALGPERVRKLGVGSERDLIAPASALLIDSLRLWGVGTRESARLIADQIEHHAARTLYELNPPPLPPQFQAYVAGLLGSG